MTASADPDEPVDAVVRDAPDRHRFELVVGDEVVGFAQYSRRGGRIVVVHTEVDPAWGGKGLGSVLARGALDAARAEGASVVPLCPFIAAFIDGHPEYADLVDAEALAEMARDR
jgi:predicted GNAT family acetyltransferase